VEKEWNTDVVWWKIIYISVVNFIFIFIFHFGVFGLRYTHLVSFSTTERVGLVFFLFLKFYLKYWKFSMFFTLPLFFIIVQWMPERAIVKHTFIIYWQFQGLHLP
jgi:hypothetical protein